MKIHAQLSLLSLSILLAVSCGRVEKKSSKDPETKNADSGTAPISSISFSPANAALTEALSQSTEESFGMKSAALACGEVQINVPITKTYSCNGKYSVVMQSDGNLVVFSGSTKKWSSYTQAQCLGSDKPGSMSQYQCLKGNLAIMQSDGNLVVYGDRRIISAYTNAEATAAAPKILTRTIYPLFDTKTGGFTNSKLIIQDDGNLVIYFGSKAIWSWMTGRI